MFKTYSKLILLLVGVAFFTGGACPSNDTTASNKVAQTEIYQSYSINQSGQSYEVTAYFRIGGKTGTTLALSSPSKVTFNGLAMQEHLNTTSGTFYTASVSSKTADGSFVFTDRQGKIYSNKVDLPRVELAAANLRTDGKSPVSIQLSGTSPEVNEMELELNGHGIFVSLSEAGNKEISYDKSGNKIVIMPAAWKDIPSGTVPVSLTVRKSVPTQQGTALGGEIMFTSNSARIYLAYTKIRSPTRPPNINNLAKNGSSKGK